MIKPHSRQLLLCLNNPEETNLGISESFFLRLYDQLTRSGQRSLLQQLHTQGYIWHERRSSGRFIGITEQGTKLISSLFPALQPPASLSWHLIIMTEATSHDAQFRTLSKQLKKELWYHLARGVFIHPFGPSPQLQHDVEALYADSVTICRVGSWESGFSRSNLVAAYHLEHLSDVFSSISREIHHLLDTLNTKKELNNASIAQIQSLIIRLEETLLVDAGLLPLIFPGSISGAQVASDLSRLISVASELCA